MDVISNQNVYELPTIFSVEPTDKVSNSLVKSFPYLSVSESCIEFSVTSRLDG